MQRDTCGRLIKQIHDALDKHVNNELRRKDLTLAQARILIELGENGGGALPLKELERSFHVAQSTVVGLVRRLEAKGLLEGFTDPKDSRVKLVRLTAEGENFLDATRQEVIRTDERLMSGLSEAEERDLLRMLRKIYENIK
jgi:DNA-binding MarR family transcriptional regulator